MPYLIRKFKPKDRLMVRKISCETAFIGYLRQQFFDNDEILADALTLYFTDYEPQSCFVAEENNTVLGYIIGSKDIIEMNKIINLKIIPYLFAKAVIKGIFFRYRNIKFLFYILKNMFKGEFFIPNFKKSFPATLHINLLKEHRYKGLGGKLIETYLNYLKVKNVSGVHFRTTSEKAKNFFIKNGFSILDLLHNLFMLNSTQNYRILL